MVVSASPFIHAITYSVVVSASPFIHAITYSVVVSASPFIHAITYSVVVSASPFIHAITYSVVVSASNMHVVMVHCYCTVIETANMKLKKDFLAASLCRQIYYLPAVVTIATWHVEGGSCINSPLELANCS